MADSGFSRFYLMHVILLYYIVGKYRKPSIRYCGEYMLVLATVASVSRLTLSFDAIAEYYI